MEQIFFAHCACCFSRSVTAVWSKHGSVIPPYPIWFAQLRALFKGHPGSILSSALAPDLHFHGHSNFRRLLKVAKGIRISHPFVSPSLPGLHRYQSCRQPSNCSGSRFCPQTHAPRHLLSQLEGAWKIPLRGFRPAFSSFKKTSGRDFWPGWMYVSLRAFLPPSNFSCIVWVPARTSVSPFRTTCRYSFASTVYWTTYGVAIQSNCLEGPWISSPNQLVFGYVSPASTFASTRLRYGWLWFLPLSIGAVWTQREASRGFRSQVHQKASKTLGLIILSWEAFRILCRFQFDHHHIRGRCQLARWFKWVLWGSHFWPAVVKDQVMPDNFVCQNQAAGWCFDCKAQLIGHLIQAWRSSCERTKVPFGLGPQESVFQFWNYQA